MMGNRKLFSTYKAYNGGNVIFGSNLRGNIIGKGCVQICDNKCRVTFSEHDSEITKDGKVIGYSKNSKAYIILKKHTRKVEESLNVTFNETPIPSKTSPLVDDDLDEEEAIKVTEKKNLESDIVDETLEIDEIVNIKESRNHPLENVIGNLNQRTLSWIVVMQEELNQFIANDVWELVPQPRNMKIIGTKWVFRNKLDENNVVSRNKARLVAQGYNQQEGIDYDETYAPVARLESIRILLAYAYALDFKLFQMDVKSAFLNGFINEEVYVAQPPRFIDFEKPDHVYKLKKALFCLKPAPKAWYDRLKSFLIKHEYKIGMVDNTLFTKKKSPNLIIVQIYVDDIIFGLTCQDMCDEFAKIMHDKFEMSMMGELNFFLGLQIKQMEYGIFFNQSKYIKEMLKKFGLEDSKPIKTPMSFDTKLMKDEECESVDSTKYQGMIELSKGANSLQAEEELNCKMAEQDIPPPTITAMKIPIIRKGEYDIWSMRMRQYICHTDHNLWDVIVNGDLEEEPAPTTGETSTLPAPKTAKQLAARRNQERVKSILLLAIPDEYLLKFHNVADAKSLWEAIKSRFGGNVESKKMQKNVHGAPISKEDINQKFLRSLPSLWNQIALIMRNKPDIDEIDIDDLYNNLRVYEDELKMSSGSNSASQNLAFLSSKNNGSTNEVSTASGDFGVSTAGGINQVPSTACAHDIAYSFLAQPTTSPQLENEDF
ncbi:retrovirus-related pol polyprotein from transposon TNT 1-94 [Tanacetum coccineum]